MSLLTQIQDDLRAYDSIARDERPVGLTASNVGLCRRRAGYLISHAEADNDTDPWNALRGTALHEFIGAARRKANPDLVQEQRCVISLDGFPISGAIDEYDPATRHAVDYKSCDADAAYWHREHGPDPEHAMQLAILATGFGAETASVIYVPVKGTFADWVECEIDIAGSLAEADVWVRDVLDNLDGELPRDKNSAWCERFCPFFGQCRGEFVDDAPLITEPVLLEAVTTWAEAKATRLLAEKREKAAKSLLAGVTGIAGTHRVTATYIDSTIVEAYTRKGYWKQDLREVR